MNKIDKVKILSQLNYAPMIASVSGICVGVFSRIWNGVAIDFKLSSKGETPICPFVDSIMQTLFKGAGKYIVALIPLTYLIGKASLESCKSNSFIPIKRQLLSYESIFSTALIATSVLFVCSQSYWIAAALNLGLDIGDLSGHVVIVLGFINTMSVGIKALTKKLDSNQKKLFLLFNLVASVACFIFLFNTTRYYHTLVETISALSFAIIFFGCSHLLATKSDYKSLLIY